MAIHRFKDADVSFDVSVVLHFLKKHIKLLLVLVVALLTIGISVVHVLIPVQNDASIVFYVSNTSFSLGLGNISISPSDISASNSLIKTYNEILHSHRFLNQLITEANLSYTHRELSDALRASSMDGTPLMVVTVAFGDADESTFVANEVGRILPQTIREIIEGATVTLVDEAYLNDDTRFLDLFPYYILVLVIVLSGVLYISVLLSLKYTKIANETVFEQITDAPILARIPSFDLCVDEDG